MLKTIFMVTALSIGGLATLSGAIVSIIVSLQTKEEVVGKCIEHRKVASGKPGYYTYAPILIIDTPYGRREVWGFDRMSKRRLAKRFPLNEKMTFYSDKKYRAISPRKGLHLDTILFSLFLLGFSVVAFNGILMYLSTI